MAVQNRFCSRNHKPISVCALNNKSADKRKNGRARKGKVLDFTMPAQVSLGECFFDIEKFSWSSRP
jgi:hypothetical protein